MIERTAVRSEDLAFEIEDAPNLMVAILLDSGEISVPDFIQRVREETGIPEGFTEGIMWDLTSSQILDMNLSGYVYLSEQTTRELSV